jgi:hypothetical protein
MKNVLGAAVAGAIALAVPLGFLILAVWWLEDRFGSISAVATVGGIVGVIVFGAGAFLAMRIQRHTLNGAADFTDAITGAQASQAGVMREVMRAERERTGAEAKIALIDAQRVDRLARQIADARVGAERERWQLQLEDRNARQQPAESPLWADADDGQGFKVWA